jgi:VanZ family protein
MRTRNYADRPVNRGKAFLRADSNRWNGALRNALLALLLATYMLSILIFSSTPGKQAPLRNYSVFNVKITNIFHVPVFAALFLLVFGTLKAWGSESTRNRYLFPFVVSSGYGVFLEVLQAYIPGRYASLTDIILNTAGVFLGFCILKYTRYIQNP